VALEGEITRIARLLEETFEGAPYYGPSIVGTLAHVTADVATRKPLWSAHSIWELVAHLTAELDYARAVIEGTAGPWVEGETTWPAITDTSGAAWQKAVQDLTRVNRAFVRAVERLDDAILDQQPIHSCAWPVLRDAARDDAAQHLPFRANLAADRADELNGSRDAGMTNGLRRSKSL
jgi:hypothetical protein